ELVDILELGMANPVNYRRMDELFSNSNAEPLEKLREWTDLMALQLENIKAHLKDRKNLSPDPRLEKYADEIPQLILPLATTNHEKFMVLRGLYHFKKKQYQKITSIERLLRDLKVQENIGLKRREALKFIPTQEFGYKTLLDHLDFNSPIFRHSLRLSVIVLLGYG